MIAVVVAPMKLINYIKNSLMMNNNFLLMTNINFKTKKKKHINILMMQIQKMMKNLMRKNKNINQEYFNHNKE